MNNYDFIAFDVETANNDNTSMCQIAFVFVKDRKIVDIWSSLINPPTDDFNSRNIRIHGLTKAHVKNSPTFAQIAPVILPRLDNQTLVHFGTRDPKYLTDTAKYYDIALPEFTFKNAHTYAKRKLDNSLFSNFELVTLCNHYGIHTEHHHNAYYDAIMLANLLLAIDKDSKEYIATWIYKKKPRDTKNLPPAWQGTSRDAIKEGIFTNCSFVFTNDFTVSEDVYSLLIAQNGGNVRDKVTKRETTHLVVGKRAERYGNTKSRNQKQAEKINSEGGSITIWTEQQFLQILNYNNIHID